MSEYIVISLIVAFIFPFLVALVSFMTWENGFKYLGAGYIFRAIIVFEIFFWVLIAIPNGGRA